MNQKVTIIETPGNLKKNISLLYNSKVKALDTETTSLSPFEGDLRLIQLSDDENTLVIDVGKIGYDLTKEAVRPILEDKESVSICHNSKFDCKWLKHKLGLDVERIFDSYLGSILIEAGIRQAKGYHGLEQTLKRYTGLEITKDEQKSNWAGELSTSQLQYAAKDAQVLLPLREAMIEKLRRLSLFRCAKLEFDCVMPVVWLELCGFYLDFDQWKAVAQENLANSKIIAAEIFKELQPVIPQGSLFGDSTINLNSTQQVQKYFTDLGIPMPESTRETFLIPLVDKYPLVGKLIEYRGLTKAAGSFGENWAEYIEPTTGRIHSNFQQMGASTGRMSSSSPNLQQIKKENLFRNCFKAEEGNALVSVDMSQIELRILADLSNDSNALKAFASGEDFHKSIAALMFRKPVEDVTKEERDIGKRINFTISYGGGVAKIAASCGLGEAEAGIILNNYFKAVPNQKRWMDKQKRDVLKTRYIRTASGRLERFIFDENDGMQRSMAQRNAVNSPVQGTSADILKRALRLFYDQVKNRQDKIKLVNLVHDEINLEVEESIAQEVSAELQDCMINAGKEFLHRVDVKADISISKVWQK